jgi:hypothetical protein
MLNAALITRAIRALAALLSLETRAALLSRASHCFNPLRGVNIIIAAITSRLAAMPISL